MLIIGGFGAGKTNELLILIKEKDSDKIYLYAKWLNKLQYQLLIEKREDAGSKNLNDPKAFIEYSSYMDDIYNNIDDYNPNRNRIILILFDDMIADIMTNKKFQAIKELFIRCKKTNISLVFITKSYYSVQRSQIKFLILLNNKDS